MENNSQVEVEDMDTTTKNTNKPESEQDNLKRCPLVGLFYIKRGLSHLVSNTFKQELRGVVAKYTQVWVETTLFAHLHLHLVLKRQRDLPAINHWYFRLCSQVVLQGRIRGPKKVPEDMQYSYKVFEEYHNQLQREGLSLHPSNQVTANLISSMATTMETNAKEHLKLLPKRITDYIQYRLMVIFRTSSTANHVDH